MTKLRRMGVSTMLRITTQRGDGGWCRAGMTRQKSRSFAALRMTKLKRMTELKMDRGWCRAGMTRQKSRSFAALRMTELRRMTKHEGVGGT
jgi:hypothetical protein